MTLSIDLPGPLEEELSIEAEREGVTISEQATFLLQLMTALTREGRKTPFRSVVQAYLRENSLDANRLADVFEGLTAFCLRESADRPIPSGDDSGVPDGPFETSDVLALLREWRSPAANRSLELDDELVVCALPPLSSLVQEVERKHRVSILGKYSHIKFSTDDFMAEKRLEIEREDRPRC